MFTFDLSFYSHKGGTGVSTVAAIVSLLASRERREMLVTDDIGTTAAIMGVSLPNGQTSFKPNDNLTVIQRESVPACFAKSDDILLISDGLVLASHGERVLVTRPCYLALRQETASKVIPTKVVVIAEPGRALGAQDVLGTVGGDHAVTIPLDPAIARAVDAGLLASRLPKVGEKLTAVIDS